MSYNTEEFKEYFGWDLPKCKGLLKTLRQMESIRLKNKYRTCIGCGDPVHINVVCWTTWRTKPRPYCIDCFEKIKKRG